MHGDIQKITKWKPVESWSMICCNLGVINKHMIFNITGPGEINKEVTINKGERVD